MCIKMEKKTHLCILNSEEVEKNKDRYIYRRYVQRKRQREREKREIDRKKERYKSYICNSKKFKVILIFRYILIWLKKKICETFCK